MKTELSAAVQPATTVQPATPDQPAPTSTVDADMGATDSAAISPLATQHGDSYDQRFDQLIKRCGDYIAAQPTIVLTLGYLLCSLLGMLFVVLLFQQFGFEVLPYLEISDFLLAALSYPWTLLSLLGWLSFIALMVWFDRIIRRRFRRFAALTDRWYSEKYMSHNTLLYLLLPMLFFGSAADSNAKLLAKEIQAGNTAQLQLNLVYPLDAQKTMSLQQVQLIARTSGYLFIYHQQQVKVIPHANVAALLPLTAPKPAQPVATPAALPSPAKPQPVKAQTAPPVTTASQLAGSP